MNRGLVFVGLIVMCTSAAAEFRFVGKDNRPEVQANRAALPTGHGGNTGGCRAGLVWLGTPVPRSGSRLTKGTGMPLEVALRRMIPAGWALNFDSVDLGKRPVTWSNTGAWQDGVEAALRNAAACARVDVAGKRFTVSEAGSGDESRMAMSTTPSTGFADPYEPLPEPAPRTRGPITPGVSGGYEARAGDTVRETLRRWAASAGWEVIWDSSRDYTVEISHRFEVESDFPSVSKLLLDSYWRQGKPVKASMYANKVLRVEDAE